MTPPARARSHSPDRSACAARCKATSDDEHAVSTVTAGPSRPRHVGDPAGERRWPRCRCRDSPRRRSGQSPDAIVVVHRPGEHAAYGCRAATPGRCPRLLDRLPGGLQQQPLLRVDPQRLPRRDPEEPGVEVGRVVEEPALAGARCVDARRRRGVPVPAPVRREGGDRVLSLGHQPPQVAPVTLTPPGIPAGHARRSRSGLAHRDAASAPPEPASGVTGQLGAAGSRPARPGVGWSKTSVAGRRRRGRGGEPVAQFDRGQGVEAQVAECPVRGDGVGVAWPSTPAAYPRTIVQHRGVPGPLRQVEEPLPSGRPVVWFFRHRRAGPASSASSGCGRLAARAGAYEPSRPRRSWSRRRDPRRHRTGR